MESFGRARIEQFILDVSQSIETSIDLCERVCQDLRPLLHQPWPPKEKASKSNIPLANGHVSNHGDGVSLQEAQTLAEVEKALAKAQRARELHGMHISSEDTHQEEDLDQLDGNQAAETSPPKPTSQLIDGQEFAVISQSSLQKLFADVKPKDLNKNSRTGKTVAPKPRPGTAQARAAYSAKVPRPQPSVKSQYKTSSAEIGRKIGNKPQGTSARNKNNDPKPNLESGKRSQPAAVKKTKSQALSSNSDKRFQKPVSAGSKQQESNSSARIQDSRKAGRQTSNTKQDGSSTGTTLKDNKVLRGREPVPSKSQKKSVDGTDHLVRKTADLKLSDSSTPDPIPDGMGDIEGSSKEEKQSRFMLKKDGADLKVPGKLRKLHSDISKLRRSLTSRVASHEATIPSQHFLHRLESKFDDFDASSTSVSKLPDRINELTAECRHLIQVAETALQTFPHQDTTWDSQYRIQILTKAIRTRLEDLKSEVQSIMEADGKQFASMSVGHHRLPGIQPPSASDCWTCEYSSFKPSVTFFLPVHDDSKGCSTQLHSAQPGQCIYEYSNLKELERLTTLQHDVQRLSLQTQLEKLIGDEMLPILESLDPSDINYLSLYRSLYGLLCHGGRLYPAVVKDNVGNVSETEM